MPPLPGRRTRTLGNLIILAFVGGQVALGVRTLALQDARYGWGMFGHHADYRIRYAWVLDDGQTAPLRADDLTGETRCIASDKARFTRYGIGGVRSWVHAYLRYRMRDDLADTRPTGAVACRARITYRINRIGEEVAETLLYPASIGKPHRHRGTEKTE